jgi:hypothetical protein
LEYYSSFASTGTSNGSPSEVCEAVWAANNDFVVPWAQAEDVAEGVKIVRNNNQYYDESAYPSNCGMFSDSGEESNRRRLSSSSSSKATTAATDGDSAKKRKSDGVNNNNSRAKAVRAARRI